MPQTARQPPKRLLIAEPSRSGDQLSMRRQSLFPDRRVVGDFRSRVRLLCPRLNWLRQIHMATAAAGVGLGLEKRFPLTAIRTPRDQPQASRSGVGEATASGDGAPGGRIRVIGSRACRYEGGKPGGAAASAAGFSAGCGWGSR